MQTSSTNATANTPTNNNSSSTSPSGRLPAPPRSESMAYPPTDTRSVVSRIQYHIRHNTRAVGASLAFIAFVIVLTSDYAHPHPLSRIRDSRSGGGLRGSSGSSSTSTHFAGSNHAGYFSVEDSAIVEDERITGYRFGFLTDLDELSRANPDSSKPQFVSHFVPGTLSLAGGKYKYQITFDENAPIRNLVTKHNEAGRGAEFSELTVFDHRLLTVDDRTGDIFEILNNPTGQDSYAVPRLVLTEGEGDTDKGMKWEWSTVKNNELYLGSMGKEFTNSDGSIANVNNLWIAIVDTQGGVRRENWDHVYATVRKALGCTTPGYIIMEAINWSEALQQWVFLPRRISTDAYNDVEDEKRGGRQLVLVSPDFTTTKVIPLELESTDPLKGFSSFAFVPDSGDRHILAIRSVEEDCAVPEPECKQRSYLVVLDVLTGKQLSPEVKYEKDWKFEGVEFFNPYVVPPAAD